MSASASPQLWGCDFSSAPSRRKPIVTAHGHWQGQRLCLGGFWLCHSLPEWAEQLAQPGPWVGGFDLPFGLPRELVEHLAWPTEWRACMARFAEQSRDELRDLFAKFCAARPVGGKFAHRATDRIALSSPSMKWVNPPVAWMLHAGVPRLIEAGVHLPGLLDGDRQRVALEAYPGLLARSVLGKTSYKSDDRARQDSPRLIARKALVEALELGLLPALSAQSVRLKLSHAQRDALVADASGDHLDAVLCLLQAGLAQRCHERGEPRYGLPDFDGLEGWITGVVPPAMSA